MNANRLLALVLILSSAIPAHAETASPERAQLNLKSASLLENSSPSPDLNAISAGVKSYLKNLSKDSTLKVQDPLTKNEVSLSFDSITSATSLDESHRYRNSTRRTEPVNPSAPLNHLSAFAKMTGQDRTWTVDFEMKKSGGEYKVIGHALKAVSVAK